MSAGRRGGPGTRWGPGPGEELQRGAGADSGRPPRPRAAAPPAASLGTSSGPRSRSSSFGERSDGGGSTRRVRALVSHSEGANHTLLRFAAGDVVEVLVPKAQNGWLYGKLEGSST